MIEVEDVYKDFGEKKLFKGLSLRLEEGVIYTMLGKSGSGKSVLIKLMVGLLEPDKGSVKIDGTILKSQEENELKKIREKFGVLFQGAGLLDSLTVGENVGIVLSDRDKIPKQEVKRRVVNALARVGLSGTEALKPAELSGGMKKRVGLARAIIMRPKYLFYDEPTAGLDPVMSATIDNLIIHISREFNITSFVVTHDLSSVFKLADKVGFLHDGQLYFEGTVDEVNKTKKRFVREFMDGRREHKN